MANKNRGSGFNNYLLESLKDDDQAVFLHIKEALESPDIKENNDYLYLLKAINDVATARGKGDLAEDSGLSRQGLHKILNGKIKQKSQKEIVAQVFDRVIALERQVLELQGWKRSIISKIEEKERLKIYEAEIKIAMFIAAVPCVLITAAIVFYIMRT